MKPTPSHDREWFRHRTILPRFADAFRGLWQAYREEPNLRFHFFAATAVGVTGYAVQLEGWEMAYLAVTVASVLFAEMVNTAVERAVDFAAKGQHHPMAAQAKQVAAGAVLLTALHAAFAALLIFGWRRGVWPTLVSLLELLRAAPWIALLPLAVGILGLIVGSRRQRRSRP